MRIAGIEVVADETAPPGALELRQEGETVYRTTILPPGEARGAPRVREGGIFAPPAALSTTRPDGSKRRRRLPPRIRKQRQSAEDARWAHRPKRP